MKIKELQKILKKKNIDFALFLNTEENKRDKAVYYFSGADPEFACLLIPKKGEAALIVGKLEEELARKESGIKNIIVLEKKLFETIKKLMKNPKIIGVDFTRVTLSEKKLISKNLKKIKLADISKDVADLRIQKTPEEISKIRKACGITDKIFGKIISGFSFRNEKEIEMFIDEHAKKNNCMLAFPPIVASGKSSSMPHYKKNNSNLQKGFCVIDFGIIYQGYNSDITRTVYIGNPSQKEKDEYYKLLGVQEETIRQLKAGMDFKKLDEGVRKVLGKPFIHGLGHGLGIDVHEPITTDKKKAILKENTILTVEPGIYYPRKFGIRIEDDILITKNGCEVLTNSRKKLIIINQ